MSDDTREIKAGMPRPTADVENGLPRTESRTPPRLEGIRAPDSMLQPQPFHFRLMGAQDVVAFDGHWVVNTGTNDFVLTRFDFVRRTGFSLSRNQFPL